jgi:16S rRNA processing protein RimM
VSDDVRWIAVGRITRSHGVKGEVAVLPLSEIDARFRPGSRLYLGQTENRTLTVASSRTHQRRLLVAFEEIDDRTQGETLKGEYLFVPASWAPELPDGEYWPHQLIGCTVVTEEGRMVGTIEEIVRGPANDVWVARGEDGEDVLVPAIRDVVTGVNVGERRIVVREVPGLTAS